MHCSFIKTGPNVLITAIFSIATLLARNTTVSPNLGRVECHIRRVESAPLVTIIIIIIISLSLEG